MTGGWSMQLKSKKFLYDMLVAARGVQKIVGTRSRADFDAEQSIRWSIERGCEIIGEALTQLRKIDAETAESLTDWHKIVGFRNVIVHGYAKLDPGRTWQVAVDDVPKLIAELEVLLPGD